MSRSETFSIPRGIAIIGMAGRFPGASNVNEFWRNLCNGVESISFFSDEEILSAGVSAAQLTDPGYVKAGGVLSEIEMFDASFFGYSPREAAIMDPQQRLFLECSWEALEHAGYKPEMFEGEIGVYVGSAMSTYLLSNLYPNQEAYASAGHFQATLSNDKDFLPTRISYKLDLRGPSVSVQTACSTSLVAVHIACQSLLSYECDMALAGGVSVSVPQYVGYLHDDGGIASPDGHCRAFDARAMGTVRGNGMGVVVLKRLDDALADRDSIKAVIRGSATNNDGALKAGYTAPSVKGQAQVIAEALAMSGVDPETITYVEAHGTGTEIGDPIEIAALTQVYRDHTDRHGFCAIGSVKTNIGHLNTAAGIAGLIKTTLALEHKQLPPSLHLEQPNPKIDFRNSAFYVNTELAEWKPNGFPRRAGVSSFGIGGTNVHLIVEEAPADKSDEVTSRPWQLLLFSAKTDKALEAATANLADYLRHHTSVSLPDLSYTLKVGRRPFSHRRALVCADVGEAVACLESLDQRAVFTASLQSSTAKPVVFVFPGQGFQHVRMGAELYLREPTFRENVDICAEILRQPLGRDLREILYPQEGDKEAPEDLLDQTLITQPALFAVEYALAKLWMKWGVRPQAMIGHSVGEYVAACLAGVFTLEDALSAVEARGRLMQAQLPGAMLAVELTEQEAQGRIAPPLEIAAVNAPSLCVVAGPSELLAEFERRLQVEGVFCHRMRTSHAFHCELMQPAVNPFIEYVKRLKLREPVIPYLSNLTGTWVTPGEATDPNYWGKHLRHTVRFAEGVVELMTQAAPILLEVGPGGGLTSLLNRHWPDRRETLSIASMRRRHEVASDLKVLLSALGKLWLAGVDISWPGFYENERRRRVPLPTYPFERARHWIDPPAPTANVTLNGSSIEKKKDLADWFYFPSWKRTLLPLAARQDALKARNFCWIVFTDKSDFGALIIKKLEREGQQVIRVGVGKQYATLSENSYAIDPERAEDYELLLKQLAARGELPRKILHLWSVTSDVSAGSDFAAVKRAQRDGFYSLLFLAQALGNITEQVRILAVSSNMQKVMNERALFPEKATLLGASRVIPQEYPHITCHSVDLDFAELKGQSRDELAEWLIAELVSDSQDKVVTYRCGNRWAQSFEPMRIEEQFGHAGWARERGVYLITGGFGGIGFTLAKHLARIARARLILIGRSNLPPHEQMPQGSVGDRDKLGRYMAQVRELENLGADVVAACADASEEEQLAAVVRRAHERFGEINGVIHAAGVAGRGVIQLKSTEEAEQVLQAKVHGTLALYSLLKDVRLDFFAMCSSLSAILGGIGQGDYSAANAFLDAFAHGRDSRQGTNYLSINWDTWQGVGMAANAKAPPRLARWRDEWLRHGLLPEEGLECFNRILNSRLPQVTVSTRNLQALIERRDQQEDRMAPSSENMNATRMSEQVHLRSDLDTPFVPLISDLERNIAQVWQDLLGVEFIGRHDNFFELGGDSLLATRVVSRLRREYAMEFPLHDFFVTPTVAALAASLIRGADERSDETFDLLLGAIESLHGQELHAALESERLGIVAQGKLDE